MEKDIYYKGYILYCKKTVKNNKEYYNASVLGREEAKFKGSGWSKEDAFISLEKSIDEVRK